MTREQRRKQVKRNRISLGFIIVELIIVCVLIPIAISRFGKKGSTSETGDETPTIISADAGTVVDQKDPKGVNVNESAGSSQGDSDSASVDTLSREAHARYAENCAPIVKNDMLGMKSYAWLDEPWPWDLKRAGEG